MKLKYLIRPKLLGIVIFLVAIAFVVVQNKIIVRLYDGAKLYFFSKDHKKFYVLKSDVNVADITDSLKEDEKIPFELREPLLKGERRIYVFKYTSDGNRVAGYLSLIPSGKHPTVLFLRGGNGNFGILRPNNIFSYLDGFNVIGTLYRGNIYGGKDEFGGEDINDIENLIRFIPELEQKIHKEIKQPFAIIGVSRGAMQMFGTLSKSNLVKKIIKKAISVSGNTDLMVAGNQRPEMLYMFKRKFQEQDKIQSLQDWLALRNPVQLSPLLDKNLSVLMIYGLNDKRVDLSEQKNFLDALDRNHINSQFVTIKNTGHAMDGHIKDIKSMIESFLKNSKV